MAVPFSPAAGQTQSPFPDVPNYHRALVALLNLKREGIFVGDAGLRRRRPDFDGILTLVGQNLDRVAGVTTEVETQFSRLRNRQELTVNEREFRSEVEDVFRWHRHLPTIMWFTDIFGEAQGSRFGDAPGARRQVADDLLVKAEALAARIRNLDPPPPYDLLKPFPDVPPDHWAYDAVHNLKRNGVLVGYPDGTFRGG